MLPELAAGLALEAARIREAFSSRTARKLERLRGQHAESFGGAWGEEQWADVCAQTLTWFEFTAALARRGRIDPGGFRWIISQEAPLWKVILQILGAELAKGAKRGARQDRGLLVERFASDKGRPSVATLFEAFLAACSSRQRARHGAFFTPPEVAQRLVAMVDSAVCTELGCPLGLADTTPWSNKHRPAAKGRFVRILDPAVGAGVFLVEAIERIHRTLDAAWRSEGRSSAEILRCWNRYVPKLLLPRLFGLELSPAACLAAHLEVGQKLAETGYRFRHPANVQIFAGNTLAQEDDGYTGGLPMTVIIGNPPFAALSPDRSSWMAKLLKGVAPGGQKVASYYDVDGNPLGERKQWLHDAYVQFLRYAQWRIERAGNGVVGLVTNHSFLDNPTFRGVRSALMQTFTRIEVVDLHGNRKKRETPADGGRDENVFNIEQGVVLSVLSRSRSRLPGGTFHETVPSGCQGNCSIGAPTEDPARQTGPTLLRADVWGTREEKKRVLGSGETLAFQPLSPSPPFYFFTVRNESLRREYERGWRLTEAMPVHVAAPVTARDGLVIAFTRKELLQRIAAFRDPAMDDETIRQRFFGPPRSHRYPRGDTRGWKLAEARQLLAGRRHWMAPARTCLYRPFDRRWIYWSEAMVDWPRREIMRGLEAPGNLALVARRQMPPTEPCSYFWITDEITLDGVIRSDNRGGETIFPLHAQGRQPNFAPDFFAAAAALTTLPANKSLAATMLRYVYALFYAPSYRLRFAEHLRIDFPRVFLPKDAALFFALAQRGEELIGLHLDGSRRKGVRSLFRREPAANGKLCRPKKTPDPLSAGVAPGFPRYEDGAVWINPQTRLPSVPEAAWEWRVGGHQVCRKWLKDRKGRLLSKDEVATYGHIVTAATETQRLASEIDVAIDGHGGWPKAFVGRPSSS